MVPQGRVSLSFLDQVAGGRWRVSASHSQSVLRFFSLEEAMKAVQAEVELEKALEVMGDVECQAVEIHGSGRPHVNWSV